MPSRSPRRDVVDIDLTDRGRALAKALLGTAVLDRPPPTPARPFVVAPARLPVLGRVDPTFGIDELRTRSGPSERRNSAVIEWMVVVIIAFAVAFLIKTYVIQTFQIPSESMEHTLEIGDRVVVNKLAYSIGGGVERGDVIVFDRPPAARTGEPGDTDELIKRVIAISGDTVETRSGTVYVNGSALKESRYIGSGVRSLHLAAPVHVGRGQVFVMGDNRPHSYDSRFFGSIPTSTILGRAIFIAWPFSRATGL